MKAMDGRMHTVKGTKGMMAEMPSNLPSFNLTEKDLPAVKGWQVGKKYRLEMEVENIGMNKDEYLEGQPMSSRLRIRKVKDLSADNSEEFKAKRGHNY